MASEASQPCAEGVSLSGAIARQGGRLHHSRCTGVTSTTQRRMARSAIVCGQSGMSGGLAVLTTYYLWNQAIEQFQLAQGELVKGNSEPVKMMVSHREDVTLLNPFSPPARGWEQVAATTERAASQFRDGEMDAFEIVAKYVTPELAYIVLVERAKAKVGGRMWPPSLCGLR
jgi:hypothetical protein